MAAHKSERLNRRIGRNIGALRRIRDLDQAALAKHAGIPLKRLRQYEAGAGRITAFDVFQIGDVLGVPITAFFQTGGFDPGVWDGRLGLNPTYHANRIAYAVRRIDRPRTRQLLVNVMELIAEAEQDAPNPRSE